MLKLRVEVGNVNLSSEVTIAVGKLGIELNSNFRPFQLRRKLETFQLRDFSNHRFRLHKNLLLASGLGRLYGQGWRRPANLDRKQSSEASSVGPKTPNSIEIQD